MSFQVGSASVDITPRVPCFLAGYAARDHAHDSVHDSLFLRAFYARSGSGEALVFSADILWFSEAMVTRISSELERTLGIPPLHVQFGGSSVI